MTPITTRSISSWSASPETDGGNSILTALVLIASLAAILILVKCVGKKRNDHLERRAPQPLKDLEAGRMTAKSSTDAIALAEKLIENTYM